MYFPYPEPRPAGLGPPSLQRLHASAVLVGAPRMRGRGGGGRGGGGEEESNHHLFPSFSSLKNVTQTWRKLWREISPPPLFSLSLDAQHHPKHMEIKPPPYGQHTTTYRQCSRYSAMSFPFVMIEDK